MSDVNKIHFWVSFEFQISFLSSKLLAHRICILMCVDSRHKISRKKNSEKGLAIKSEKTRQWEGMKYKKIRHKMNKLMVQWSWAVSATTLSSFKKFNEPSLCNSSRFLWRRDSNLKHERIWIFPQDIDIVDREADSSWVQPPSMALTLNNDDKRLKKWQNSPRGRATNVLIENE